MRVVAKGAPWPVFEGTRLAQAIARDPTVHAEKLDERYESILADHVRSSAMWFHDRVPETDQKIPR